MKLKVSLVTLVVVIATLLGAAPASATVTSSTVAVTSPTGTYLLDDQVTPNETIAVTGTSNGKTGDHVDINCYDGGGFAKLGTDVAVAAGGSFSYTGTLSAIAKQTCVLRAVPTGDTTDYPPGVASPFTGPTLAVDQVTDTDTPGGHLEYYYLYDSQSKGAFDYSSLGNCTIADSYLYDPVTFASTTLDFCDAWFNAENGENQSGFATPWRSELQVDGVNAYLPGDFTSLTGMPTPSQGFPSLTYSYSIDPATGDLALNETDQAVECSPDPEIFPPTAKSCSTLVPAGIEIRQHIVQTDSGLVASVTQYFSSTDGLSHGVALLEDNQFNQPNFDGRLNFPWTGMGLTAYTTPGAVIVPPGSAGPGSFFVQGSQSAGSASAQGAVTFSNAPSSETIVGTTSANFSWVDLEYLRTVPATGSVPLGFTYSNGFSAGAVASEAAAAQTAFFPSVSITSPKAGAVNLNGRVVVSGRASDANGLASLTVDGHAATVSPGGSWSTTMALHQGANSITAVATNIFGNAATANASVVYTPLAVTSFTESHAHFRERGRNVNGKPPVGTSFSFWLNAAASVRLVFTETLLGRVVAGKCVAPTQANQHQPECTRTVTVGTLSLAGHVGRNIIGSFKGRIAGRTLAPGTYTVTLTASADETTSAPRRLSFTIVS
jgi:hypothetical protein